MSYLIYNKTSMHEVPSFSSVITFRPFFMCSIISQVTQILAVIFCILWLVKSHVCTYRALRYNYANVGFLRLKAERESFSLDTH